MFYLFYYKDITVYQSNLACVNLAPIDLTWPMSTLLPLMGQVGFAHSPSLALPPSNRFYLFNFYISNLQTSYAYLVFIYWFENKLSIL